MKNNRLTKIFGLLLLILTLSVFQKTINFGENVQIDQINKNSILKSQYVNDFPDWIIENYSRITKMEDSIWGWERDIFVKGDYAYLCIEHEGLVIVDVSNPSSPEIVSVYKKDDVDGIYVQGNYAYVISGNPHLEIIDIYNAYNPRKVGEFSKIPYNDIVVDGPIAFLVSDINGLRVLNISNPTKPIEITRIGVGKSSSYSLFIKENLVFTGEQDGGFKVYDCSDVYHPKLISEYIDSSYTTIDICVEDNYVCLADPEGISIIEIKNLTNPYFVMHESIRTVQEIKLNDNLIYVASYQDGIKIYDLSNYEYPSYITKINEYATRSFFYHNNKMYLLFDYHEKHPFSIYDVSDPVSCLLLSSLKTRKSIIDFEFLSNNLITLDDSFKIRIHNISNILQPEIIVSNFDIPETYDFELNGFIGYYYTYGHLQAIDFSNIALPTRHSDLGPYLGGVDYFQIHNNMIYAIDYNENLNILKFVDNFTVENITKISTDMYQVTKIIINEGYAYILGRNEAWERLFQIIDVIDPYNPISKSTINLESFDYARDMCFESNLVYFAGNRGLTVYSVSNPSNPIFLTTYNYSKDIYNTWASIFIKDKIAYIQLENIGLEVVNTSNLGDIKKIGSFFTIDDVYTSNMELFNNKFICYNLGVDGIEFVGIDSDSDGLADKLEDYHNTDIYGNDTDSDLLSDGFEIYYLQSNPNSNDSDSDNITDTDEVFIYGTNPSYSDTDHDSISDFMEIMDGTDPLNPNDPIWQFTASTGSISYNFPEGLSLIIMIIIYFTKKKRKNAS